jgi:hypothetical protein
MLDSIKLWFQDLDLSFFMEHTSNDKLMEYITHPIGIGVCVTVIAFTLFMKWRITFVCLSALLAGVFVVRYTITAGDGPNKTIFLFIGGAVVLAAFIIYLTLMSDE